MSRVNRKTNYIYSKTEFSSNKNNHKMLKVKEITIDKNILKKANEILEEEYIDNFYDILRKTKDIFIDKKIPLLERDNWPIVVDSEGKVVWIPGIKKSRFDRKKTESYDIILKYR